MNPLSTRPNRWRPITVFNQFVGLTLLMAVLTGCQTVDERGFDLNTKVNTKTKNLFDENGMDFFGRNKLGFDREGYNEIGYNREGFNKNGFNSLGLDKDGFDKNGFDKNSNNRETSGKFNKAGFDVNGVDAGGFDIDGYDINGRNRSGAPKKVYVTFTSELFTKDLKVDGFTVDWPTTTTREFIVNSSYDITRPRDKSVPTEQPVETDLVVEYINFSMNGFGHHSNESSKRKKVKIKYIRGTAPYYIAL